MFKKYAFIGRIFVYTKWQPQQKMLLFSSAALNVLHMHIRYLHIVVECLSSYFKCILNLLLCSPEVVSKIIAAYVCICIIIIFY